MTKKSETTRTFIAPGLLDASFIVKGGKLTQAPANAFSGGLPIDLRRDGDVVARFVNCILQTDDLDIIEWCVEHPDICRDANDPQAEAWATLKQMTIETSTKEATLPPGTDIDAMLRGEKQPGGPESLVERARNMT
jgi:hypothetical protein